VPYAGTITGFTDAHTVTCSVVATNNVVNGFAGYGTDNLAKLNAAVNALPAQGGTITLPAGAFATSDAWAVPGNVAVVGAGRTQTSLYLIASVTQAGANGKAVITCGAGGGVPVLADRVSLRSLRVGVIPSDARSFRGGGVLLIATN